MERHQMLQMISKNDKYISIYLKVLAVSMILIGLSLFSLPFLSKKILTIIDIIGVRGEFYSFAKKLLQAANYNAAHYPFMGYSTDWLGFALLMFALLLVGPIMDHNKNEWVVRFGLMVFALSVPIVFLAGWVREIPIVWRSINCLFSGVGVFFFYKVFSMIKTNQELNRAIEALNEKKINPDIRVA